MGYSCRADAAYALERIEAASQAAHGAHHSGLIVNNAGKVVGFYERGRENADGAITGSIFRVYGEFPWAHDEQSRLLAPCKRAGSFRISPDGEVERFPLMAKAILAKATDPNAPRGLGAI